MMSSIRVNNSTVSMCYNGDTNTSQSVTLPLVEEDIITYHSVHDNDHFEDLLMTILEKLELASSRSTFTIADAGMYLISAGNHHGTSTMYVNKI
jgi:hypothetical protein